VGIDPGTVARAAKAALRRRGAGKEAACGRREEVDPKRIPEVIAQISALMERDTTADPTTATTRLQINAYLVCTTTPRASRPATNRWNNCTCSHTTPSQPATTH
jgi:hypothetical protein